MLTGDDAAQPVGAEDGFEHPRQVGTAPKSVPTIDIDDLAGVKEAAPPSEQPTVIGARGSVESSGVVVHLANLVQRAIGCAERWQARMFPTRP